MLHSSQFTYIHCTSIHEIRLRKKKVITKSWQWSYGYIGWWCFQSFNDQKRSTFKSLHAFWSIIKCKLHKCRNIVLHLHWCNKCLITQAPSILYAFYLMVKRRQVNFWSTIWSKLQFKVMLPCERWIDQHDTSLGQRKNDFDSANPSNMQDACHSVKWPCSSRVLVAQWIEHPPGVWEVMGSIPVGDSEFFLCPTLMLCWSIHLSFYHLYPLITLLRLPCYQQ